MSDAALTLLKFAFLALLFVFLSRVVLVVVREMRATLSRAATYVETFADKVSGFVTAEEAAPWLVVPTPFPASIFAMADAHRRNEPDLRAWFRVRGLVTGVLSGAVAVATARLGYERLVRLSPLVLLITILALALVLIPGIGQPERGREAMLSLGPLSFQPASVAAGAVLLYLAAWMTRRAPVASDDLPETLRYTSLVGLVGALLMLQMNVAAALTIASVGAAMFAIGGGNLRHLVTFVASGLFMWFVVVVSGTVDVGAGRVVSGALDSVVHAARTTSPATPSVLRILMGQG